MERSGYRFFARVSDRRFGPGICTDILKLDIEIRAALRYEVDSLNRHVIRRSGAGLEAARRDQRETAGMAPGSGPMHAVTELRLASYEAEHQLYGDKFRADSTTETVFEQPGTNMHLDVMNGRNTADYRSEPRMLKCRVPADVQPDDQGAGTDSAPIHSEGEAVTTNRDEWFNGVSKRTTIVAFRAMNGRFMPDDEAGQTMLLRIPTIAAWQYQDEVAASPGCVIIWNGSCADASAPDRIGQAGSRTALATLPF